MRSSLSIKYHCPLYWNKILLSSKNEFLNSIMIDFDMLYNARSPPRFSLACKPTNPGSAVQAFLLPPGHNHHGPCIPRCSPLHTHGSPPPPGKLVHQPS